MILDRLPGVFWEQNYTYPSYAAYKRVINDNNVEIEIALPGVGKEDISLNYLSEKLSINITVESKGIDKDIYISNQVDPEAIEATLDKGLLKIVAPIKTNNIEIKIK